MSLYFEKIDDNTYHCMTEDELHSSSHGKIYTEKEFLSRFGFKDDLEKKLSLSQSCTDLSVLRNVKKYVLRGAMVSACINNSIPLRASTNLWETFIRKVKRSWEESMENEKDSDEFDYPGFHLHNVYQQIQSDQKYCYKAGKSNFISDLYMTGKCNCNCGTDLLFTIASLFRKKPIKILIPRHTYLLLPPYNYHDFTKIETTQFAAQRWSPESITLDKLLEIDILGWLEKDRYVAMNSFLSDVIIARGTKTYDLDIDEKIELFHTLFGRNEFTNLISDFVTLSSQKPSESDANKLNSSVRSIVMRTEDIDQLSILNVVILYLTLVSIPSFSEKILKKLQGLLWTPQRDVVFGDTVIKAKLKKLIHDKYLPKQKRVQDIMRKMEEELDKEDIEIDPAFL